MNNRRIFLIRHGQSEGNVDKKVYGYTPDYKIKLTSLGEKQAIEAGNKLNSLISPSADEDPIFFVSPYRRTRDTFSRVAAYYGNYHAYEDPRLVERMWGNMRSHVITDEIEKDKKKFANDFFFRFPDGETCLDVFVRIKSFINELEQKVAKIDPKGIRPIVIVGHGTAIKVFLMAVLDWSVEDFEAYRHPRNGEIIQITDGVLKTKLRKHRKSKKND